MNILSFYTKIFGMLHNYGPLPVCFFTPLRFIISKMANKFVPICLSKNKVEQRGKIIPDLIVSLTSYPARINNVWLVIQSLKNQTILPEKIILWLYKEQFPTDDLIPQNLKDELCEMFEIRFVNENIRSHTKYLYTLRNFPDNTFITCDDDILYDPKMIERLVITSKEFPNCIISNNTSQIVFDKNGIAKSYLNWLKRGKDKSSSDLLQLGVSGVLYPPHSLHELVSRIDLLWELSPLADDIWLNAMARLKGTPIVQTANYHLTLCIESNSPTLSSVNNGMKMNDKQINQIREYLIANNMLDVYSTKCHVEYLPL